MADAVAYGAGAFGAGPFDTLDRPTVDDGSIPYGNGTYGNGLYGLGANDPTPTTPTGPELPTVPAPARPANPDWTSADPGLSIIGVNGDEIAFRLDDTDFLAETGASGFGIPPRVLSMFEGASDGALVRFTRTSYRDIDLPIGIFGDTRGQVGDRQRRLAAALRARPRRPPARLRFALETGQMFETPVHYVAGAETTIGKTGTRVYCRWPITLRCPDPYWTSTEETTFLLGGTGTGRGLLPNLVRLPLISSQVLGSTDVLNVGDVEADITWIVKGPGGPFTATSSTGSKLVLNTVLTATETITIDTAAGTVTDQSGANRYRDLADAPKLFRLPEGPSTVTVSMPSATSDSLVIGRYRPRREVMY